MTPELPPGRGADPRGAGSTVARSAAGETIQAPARRIPLAVKWIYTAFLAVLVPIYWTHYGPLNFL